MIPTHYEILGVSKEATGEEIKTAYRKLAMEWHPDRNDAPEAEEKFKEASEAYDVLCNTRSRNFYDTYGHSDHLNFDDIFSAFEEIFREDYEGFDNYADWLKNRPRPPMSNDEMVKLFKRRVDQHVSEIKGRKAELRNLKDYVCLPTKQHTYCTGCNALMGEMESETDSKYVKVERKGGKKRRKSDVKDIGRKPIYTQILPPEKQFCRFDFPTVLSKNSKHLKPAIPCYKEKGSFWRSGWHYHLQLFEDLLGINVGQHIAKLYADNQERFTDRQRWLQGQANDLSVIYRGIGKELGERIDKALEFLKNKHGITPKIKPGTTNEYGRKMKPPVKLEDFDWIEDVFKE